MRTVDLITKKRDGAELSAAEIDHYVQGIVSGDIPDYQSAALAMAIYFRGMSSRETADLTLAMARSGEMLDLTDVTPGVVVDKHSTGGVGDKTTLVVAPVVAACGVPLGKMSGRGLGYSGGTLDKMESFPGYQVGLTTEQFKAQLAEIGLVLAGQSADLAPADGKLYALRDVTGAVPSIPLIASSVMSKKIAAGAQAIVLDVKLGSGAFMPDLDRARELAQTMVAIGRNVGRDVVALLADMNQPLGKAVGNVIEVREAIDTLRGDGPADFREHALRVSDYLLILAGRATTLADARELTERAVTSGQALDRFRQLVAAQGGDATLIDDPERFVQPSLAETLRAPHAGYVAEVNARAVGEAAVLLGAGRAQKGDELDLAVGILVHKKVGDAAAPDEPLLTLLANDPERLEQARARLSDAVQISRQPTERLPLFYGVVGSSLSPSPPGGDAPAVGG